MVRELESWTGKPFWKEQRRVYVTLTRQEFVAQGVEEPSGNVVFEVRGSLEQLGGFSERVSSEGATVVIRSGSPRSAGLERGALPSGPLTGNTSGEIPPSPGPKGRHDDGEEQRR